MLALLPVVLALVAQPPMAGRADNQVLVTLTTGTDDVGLGRAVDAAVANELSQMAHLDIVTVDDLRRRLAMEGERQTLGCDDTLDACVAELKNAMAVPWVLYASVAVVGDTAVVSLTLTDANGAVVGRALHNTPRTGASLTADLRAPVADVMRPLEARLGVAPTSNPWPALQAAGGVGVVVGAGVTAFGLLPLLAQARAASALQTLRTNPADLGSRLAQATSLQKAQASAQSAWNDSGAVVTAVGAVVVVAGAASMVVAVVGGGP